MRVLLTTDTVGGVWTFTKELTQNLLAKGHSVALVTFGPAASAKQNKWAKALVNAHGESFDFHASEAPLEWMQNNDAAWASGEELLTSVAKTFQADILHSSQFCWGALPLKMPKLITAHSDVRSWASACRGGDLAPSPWLDRYDSLVQQGIADADAMVAPTEWMRDALKQHYEIVSAFDVIPNGRTIPEVAMKCERKRQAVSVGRLWDEGKGLAILSEFLSPMPVVLAGERFFERDADCVLPSNVVNLGTLDEASLFQLFSASSVYLATSLYEPFGLAPLEAALCGCAIVARDLASFREVWGDAALYFEDAVTLRNILTELWSNPTTLNRARGAAAERARTFTATRMADSYACLYRQLIEGASSRIPAIDKRLHAA